jgi:hypothetical protein
MLCILLAVHQAASAECVDPHNACAYWQNPCAPAVWIVAALQHAALCNANVCFVQQPQTTVADIHGRLRVHEAFQTALLLC